MKKFIVLFLILLVSSAETQEIIPAQSIFIIDCPTSATLDRGSFMAGLRAYPEGGILGNIEVGLTNRLMMGISYGGKNIIGAGEIDWNPQVGVNIRYRMFDEQLNFPAVSIGYDNQGNGAYIDSLSRYTEKSRGIFATFSKSYRFLGVFALHGGINYSFEDEDGDKDINGFFGFEKSVNDELSIFGEYDLAINDNEDNSIGSGKGYLNAGVKWSFAKKLYIDFLWKNILENQDYRPYSSREIRLYFVEYFR
ncbi:MAG: hypothetical protein AB7T22_01735 [Calditrichaceae bacterium]